MLRYIGVGGLGAILGGAAMAFVMNGQGAATSEPTSQSEIVAVAEDAAVLTPAYMVVLGTVTDRDAFMEGYASKLAPIYEQYGGHYLSIGGQHEVLEGETSFKSHVISRWPGGVSDAQAFWNSPEYTVLKEARIQNDWGKFDVFLVPGLPQSPDSD